MNDPKFWGKAGWLRWSRAEAKYRHCTTLNETHRPTNIALNYTTDPTQDMRQ